MGVTILYQYNVKDRPGPQAIEYLGKQITNLGARSTGQFIVECDTYVTTTQSLMQPRTVHVLHNSELPASVFSILDNGSKTVPIVADSILDVLIAKMSNIIQKRQKMESRGLRYELNDFCIKIGSVTLGSNFKGVLLEIEYKPCVIPCMCWELMKEFIQGFLGPNILNNVPNYIQNHYENNYQPIDTIQQYLEHFNIFRKNTGVMQYS